MDPLLYIDLEKSAVKGHNRRTSRGGIVYVRSYMTKRKSPLHVIETDDQDYIVPKTSGTPTWVSKRGLVVRGDVKAADKHPYTLLSDTVEMAYRIFDSLSPGQALGEWRRLKEEYEQKASLQEPKEAVITGMLRDYTHVALLIREQERLLEDKPFSRYGVKPMPLMDVHKMSESAAQEELDKSLEKFKKVRLQDLLPEDVDKVVADFWRWHEVVEMQKAVAKYYKRHLHDPEGSISHIGASEMRENKVPAVGDLVALDDGSVDTVVEDGGKYRLATVSHWYTKAAFAKRAKYLCTPSEALLKQRDTLDVTLAALKRQHAPIESDLMDLSDAFGAFHRGCVESNCPELFVDYVTNRMENYLPFFMQRIRSAAPLVDVLQYRSLSLSFANGAAHLIRSVIGARLMLQGTGYKLPRLYYGQVSDYPGFLTRNYSAFYDRSHRAILISDAGLRSFYHELGHFIDHAAADFSYMSSTSRLSDTGKLVRIVTGSPQFEAHLQKIAAEAPAEKAEAYVAYLKSPEEVFARAFTQFCYTELRRRKGIAERMREVWAGSKSEFVLPQDEFEAEVYLPLRNYLEQANLLKAVLSMFDGGKSDLLQKSVVEFSPKKEMLWNGIHIVIENKKGNLRQGQSKDGEEWKVKMPADYGFVNNTKGADGEGVDVFVGPEEDSKQVYVFQLANKNGEYDEDKVVLGVSSKRKAKKILNSAYTFRPKVLWIDNMSLDDFKARIGQAASIPMVI